MKLNVSCQKIVAQVLKRKTVTAVEMTTEVGSRDFANGFHIHKREV